MKKKLPGVFPGPVKSDSGNNKMVFYSSKSDGSNDLEDSKNNINNSRLNKMINLKKDKNINQKLNEIFNASNYIYKADVELILKDKVLTKKIIGRNKNYLITMNNELIPIVEIMDIKQK